MNKLFTLVIPYREDEWPVLWDYTGDVVIWKRISRNRAQLTVLEWAVQGNIIVKGDGRHPLGVELHIVPRVEYDRTIERKGKVK